MDRLTICLRRPADVPRDHDLLQARERPRREVTREAQSVSQAGHFIERHFVLGTERAAGAADALIDERGPVRQNVEGRDEMCDKVLVRARQAELKVGLGQP